MSPQRGRTRRSTTSWRSFARSPRRPRRARPRPSRPLAFCPRFARSFAVCDNWFASAPTQTFPNRSFLHAGTSNGFVTNGDPPEDWAENKNRTVFNELVERTRDPEQAFRIYHHHDTALPVTFSIHWPMIQQYYGPPFLAPVTQFIEDARRGDLPKYSFIEPRVMGYFDQGESKHLKPNDQHPNCDIRLGENLILDVYRAVVTSPLWERTLLVIVYDEHGGLYDHVPPPWQGVPAPPPGGGNQFGFDFRRLGVRVPAVLVSPYIEAGTVWHPGVWVDHTAVIRTLVNRFNLSSLTARDQAAPDLAGALTRKRPRTEAPPIPAPWPLRPKDLEQDPDQPINNLQHALLRLATRSLDISLPQLRTHGEAAAFVDKVKSRTS